MKFVSSDFLMIKKIVAPHVFKSWPLKLICCGAINLVCLLKSIEINLNFFENKQKSNKLPVVQSLLLLISIIFFVGYLFIFYWQVKETFSIKLHILFWHLVHNNVKNNLYNILLYYFLQQFFEMAKQIHLLTFVNVGSIK